MAIYKRGNVWWMSFQLNGRHVQKSTKLSNKRDAEAYERAFRTQLAKGEVGFAAKIDFPAFDIAMANFLSWIEVEHRSKPNTVRSYRSTSKALIAFFGSTEINRVDTTQVENFKLWRSQHKAMSRSTSRKRGASAKARTSRTLKPATINRELALLKIFFNFYSFFNVFFRL